MNKEILENLEEILRLDSADFDRSYGEAARRGLETIYGDGVFLSGILALSNYCVNDCRYCGLRSESCVNRFRLDEEQLKNGIDYLESRDIRNVILISGEDPGFDRELLRTIIEYAAEKSFYISLGAGLFDRAMLQDFYDAGARELCLKFETADRELFKQVKPSSDFDARIACIKEASEIGYSIATGSIIGLEGQSLESVADDLRYTLELEPSWIPLVPYMPAPGTPMAETTPMGDIDLTLKAISLLRILHPSVKITAGQPARGSKLGFADPSGNAAALRAGANIFFVDATPAAVKEDFSIVGGRVLAAHENILKIISDNGKTVI